MCEQLCANIDTEKENRPTIWRKGSQHRNYFVIKFIVFLCVNGQKLIRERIKKKNYTEKILIIIHVNNYSLFFG